MSSRSEPAMSVEATLQERGARYGNFMEHAVIAQALLDILRGSPGWEEMAPDQRQALGAICDKLGRMANGDPHYIDNWQDIAGYATLVRHRLEEDAELPVAGAARVSSVRLPKLLRKSESPSTQSSEASQ